MTDHPLTYRVVTKAPAGATITVKPSTFTVKPRADRQTSRSRSTAGKIPSNNTTPHFGQITLDEVRGTHDLHLPVAFTRGQGAADRDDRLRTERHHPRPAHGVDLHRDGNEHELRGDHRRR